MRDQGFALGITEKQIPRGGGIKPGAYGLQHLTGALNRRSAVPANCNISWPKAGRQQDKVKPGK